MSALLIPERLDFQSTLLLLSLTSSALFFILRNTKGEFTASWLIKFSAVFCLSIYVVMVERLPIHRILASGLFMHSLGDLGLELSKDDAADNNMYVVIAGSSFLVGHIIYGYVFWSTTQKLDFGFVEMSSFAFIFLLTGYTIVTFVRYLNPKRVFIKTFCMFYLTALTSMGVMAVLSRGVESIGGMLYILSDCIIFVEVVGSSFPLLRGPAVWPLYYTAQCLITYGVLHLKKHI